MSRRKRGSARGEVDEINKEGDSHVNAMSVSGADGVVLQPT